jgi:hypothetical protein
MTYRMQDRLQHASDRFAEVNTESVIYIRGTTELPIAASPILISADEIMDGDPAATRTERQDWGIIRSLLGSLYPPRPNDKIRRQGTGEEFVLASMGRDEPPYVHVTSNRSRVIVHTVRTKV